jgi:cell wall-associated NlpC family hydrolase
VDRWRDRGLHTLAFDEVSVWRDTRAPGPRTRPSRNTLAGALAGVALVALAVVLALTLGRSHRTTAGTRVVASVPAAAHKSSAHAGPAVAVGSAGGGRAARPAAGGTVGGAGTATRPPTTQTGAAPGGKAATVAEVRDPEESKSFPVATSHHTAAIAPSAAAEEVAPGAPSNAEVRAELNRMHAVESAARKQEAATATTVPGGDSIGGDGQLPIPQDVPEVVQRVIAGANAITDFPYVYGGGHASFVDTAYDCSGSVSYALAAGGLLSAPETSGALESWGEPGPGKWITVYANAGHTYMYVNIGGRWMRFDTVGRSGPYASRWQPEVRSNAGFVARHWPGL